MIRARAADCRPYGFDRISTVSTIKYILAPVGADIIRPHKAPPSGGELSPKATEGGPLSSSYAKFLQTLMICGLVYPNKRNTAVTRTRFAAPAAPALLDYNSAGKNRAYGGGYGAQRYVKRVWQERVVRQKRGRDEIKQQRAEL